MLIRKINLHKGKQELNPQPQRWQLHALPLLYYLDCVKISESRYMYCIQARGKT
jgi:hypothetical protein